MNSSTGQAIRGGIGAALRAERERRHVSLDAVARGTLVRPDFLELIDSDRLEQLPTGAYAKGFIRAYAIYLGLDPKPFLRAYEQRCGRPEPELSRVVRRGVRVPPRAHKRAWKIAVLSAGGLIVLLAFFGAFRSGDNTAQVPTVSAASARMVLESAPPQVMGAIVRVEALQDAWMKVEVDGHPRFAETLRRGDFRTFKGEHEVAISVVRSAAIRITANGRILGAPSTSPYRGVFTPGTTTLPPNEPIEPAKPPPSSSPSRLDKGSSPTVPQDAYTGQ